MSNNPDIWLAWARSAVDEAGGQLVPDFVTRTAHPTCKDPRHAWCMLLGIERERKALGLTERLPREVVGLPNASWADAQQHLDKLAVSWANELAFGTL